MTETYYKTTDDNRRLVPAPKVLETTVDGHLVNIANPKPDVLVANGYHTLADEPTPTPPEGKVAVFDGYALDETDGKWHAQYHVEDAPPPMPRKFSKLKCVVALTRAGVWDAVKAYIEQAGLYDLYLAAQDFAEDNDYFTQGKAQLQTALGWDDEQVEAILAECVLGDGTAGI